MFTFKNYVDKVYIINLHNSVNRKRDIMNMLIERGFYNDILNNTIEFYTAVKVPSMDVATLQYMNSRGLNDFYSLAVKKFTVGSFNCSNEHYRLYNLSVMNGYERVLIIEDDISFIKDIDFLIKAMETIPSQFNILHMEGFYWPADEEDEVRCKDVLQNNHGWIESSKLRLWDTAGLLFSSKGLRKMIELQNEKFMFADYYTFLMEDNCFFYEKPLMIQRPILSDNTMEYNCMHTTNVYLNNCTLEEYI